MKIVPCCLAMFLLVTCIAIADPYVTATYTPIDSGYRLEFVIYLDQWHGSLYGWGLYTTEIADLAAPIGWQAGTDIRKTNWDSLSPEYDVPPGGILRGSAGTFTVLPATLDYFTRMTLGGTQGTVIPVPVPEPSSLLALAGGAAGLGGLAVRRKRS